jgi:thiamine pyrophosphate-dependent acetolactate synthase large subunit-like protein
MYTLQALWTMAREKLNVTTVIFNNASYSVLNVELERVGAERIGPKAARNWTWHGPVLNFVQLAQGMGVHAQRCQHRRRLRRAFERALADPGPAPDRSHGAGIPQRPQTPRAALAAALAAQPATGGGARAQAKIAP